MHMGNEAHRAYGVQGVWATWAIGYRGMGYTRSHVLDP